MHLSEPVAVFVQCRHFCVFAYLSADLSFCKSQRVSVLWCMCVCVCVCVTKPLTSNKNSACQIQLLEQSAITQLTCSLWELMLTVMDGANETSKCERCPEEHIMQACMCEENIEGCVHNTIRVCT